MDHIQTPRKNPKKLVCEGERRAQWASLLQAFLEGLVIWFPGFDPRVFLLISHLLLNPEDIVSFQLAMVTWTFLEAKLEDEDQF
jgi:hypothetical protein